ncbi:hypothetical protein NQT65_07540 [Pseudoalteromonas agarivorans]|uniref:hypothetical protein n=1 Tax=Pseudoalteromonas TaxID=53246 RepID=UPI00110BE50B|nr:MULTISPECIES: hypothetical protein [Pseudoalteromonas]MCQ8820050.1 hypothetical protein [Pseudoalteromonas agarivorans]TMP18900.1 hypothetical protein CWC04_04670 [Pseudoalteromonas sp. S2893]
MKYLFLISLIVSFSSLSNEVVNNQIENTIKSYLEVREGYVVKNKIKGVIDGYSKEITIIQWSMLGATYWQDYLSVFSADNSEVSTMKLFGIVQNVQVKAGIIRVNIKQKMPDDPRCCPSGEEEQFYHLKNGDLTRLK